MSPGFRLRHSWATQGQLECIELFCDLVGGHHNVLGSFVDIGADGVCIRERRSFATFDGDFLTKAVFLAHRRCIRIEIQSAGSGALWVVLHKRKGVAGGLMDRHPTLEQALQEFEKRWPHD